jgi:predicted metal-dependent hydrolase
VVFGEIFAECSGRAERHGIQPEGFKIRKMTNRWGSCTSEGHILLNIDLIVAPVNCIEYVIVHELCHLKEHNHSKKFYMLLSAMMPDWERRRERLNRCVAE